MLEDQYPESLIVPFPINCEFSPTVQIFSFVRELTLLPAVAVCDVVVEYHGALLLVGEQLTEPRVF